MMELVFRVIRLKICWLILGEFAIVVQKKVQSRGGS